MGDLHRSQNTTTRTATPLIFTAYRRLSSPPAIEELLEKGIKFQEAPNPNYASAIECYSKILEMDSSHIPARNNRGLCFIQQGHLEKALPDFNYILQLDSKNIAALNNRASVYYSIGEFTKALDDYNRVLELEPSHSDAKYNITLIQNELNKGCCVIL